MGLASKARPTVTFLGRHVFNARHVPVAIAMLPHMERLPLHVLVLVLIPGVPERHAGFYQNQIRRCVVLDGFLDIQVKSYTLTGDLRNRICVEAAVVIFFFAVNKDTVIHGIGVRLPGRVFRKMTVESVPVDGVYRP